MEQSCHEQEQLALDREGGGGGAGRPSVLWVWGLSWKPKLTGSTRSALKTLGALQVGRLMLTLSIKGPFCPTL